jgi:hypothetical protein
MIYKCPNLATYSPSHMKRLQIFISYAGHDAFEAALLQFAIETLLAPEGIMAWTFQRDQSRSEKAIAAALKKSVYESIATILIVSPSTIDGGAAQWIELAYSDAFNVKTFVLLHHLDFNDLKNRERGAPHYSLRVSAIRQWNGRTLSRTFAT